MSKESKSRENLFLLEELYSEPRAIFTVGLKLIDDIKDDCLVVLDTGALLSPYGVGKESLEKIGEVYGTLAAQKRLIVPAHVAREFAENRPTKLTGIHKELLERKSSFLHPAKPGKAYHLLESLPEYNQLLEKEKQVVEQVKELRNDYFAVIEHLTEKVSNWLWNDPVTSVYASIFADDVLFSPTFGQRENRQ